MLSVSYIYYIYIRKTAWALFPLLLCSLMMCANNWMHYVPMAVFICLHITLPQYHHYADISECTELLQCLSGIFCWVCRRLSQFSRLSFMQYMGLWVFSLPITFEMIVRIDVFYLIIIIKSEVWPISHCLGLGHEMMVCTVCLSMFLWEPAAFLWNKYVNTLRSKQRGCHFADCISKAQP